MSSSFMCSVNNVLNNTQDILNRITPIDYYNPILTTEEGGTCPSQKGTLIVDSNQFIYGQLSFPTCAGGNVGTVINGDNIATNNLEANTAIFNSVLFGAGIAIGDQAGYTGQNVGSVAIGNQSGYAGQGQDAVAIGNLAGPTNQHDNTIIINASGAILNSGVSGGLYIAPVRNAATSYPLYYNPTTKEITYGP